MAPRQEIPLQSLGPGASSGRNNGQFLLILTTILILMTSLPCHEDSPAIYRDIYCLAYLHGPSHRVCKMVQTMRAKPGNRAADWLQTR